jgi:diguanylate cyclase (GGDEF)-like protein/PAS domain S-box-containing protein
MESRLHSHSNPREWAQALRQCEERLQSLLALSSDWYWEQDDQHRMVEISGIVLDTIQDYIGKTRWEASLGVVPASGSWKEHQATLEAREPFRDLELVRTAADGSVFYYSISGSPFFDEKGVFKGYRGVSRDISERKRADAQIHYLAGHDGLTALPNRRLFSELLNNAIQNARRYHHFFAILFIDLDRFKIINDTLGHEAGDQLLREISARLTSSVRGSDIVARLGGDEFVILLQEIRDAGQAAAVARKILTAVIKPMPTDALDEAGLMKNADIAMYRAKSEGKNTFYFYSLDILAQSLERLALETSLRHAVERNEFVLHYQAKLDLKSGQINGVEALLRWQHPDLGMISPLQFIPLAEETGLIVPIGKWVLKTACMQNMAWQKQGLPPVRIAVNISTRQFADDELLEDIALALADSGLAPQLLELELTESMVMQNHARAAKLLVAIKMLGVRLAIADFGVGYSSLAQLRQFPFDVLKVDRSIIRDLSESGDDQSITQAIIAMGKTLSLTVVAEGVETEAQESFLRDNACDETQGYFFSKPISSHEFADFLEKHVVAA